MKIRRLHSAVLAVALGAGVLAGTAPAFAVTQTSATVAASPWPARNWYPQGPYATMADCAVDYQDAAQNGQYTGIIYCHWWRGGGVYPAGFYYEVFIP